MTPGTRTLRFWKLRPVGSASIISLVSDFFCVTLCVSMSGLWPETVIVSSMPPTLMLAVDLRGEVVRDLDPFPLDRR